MSDYETKRIFSENLTRHLHDRRMSQLELSRSLGVSPSTVSAWCAGEKMPRMDKVERMAELLGVPPTALLRHGEDPAADAAAVKAALWGGDRDLSDEDLEALWADVREYAAFKAQQRKRQKEQA